MARVKLLSPAEQRIAEQDFKERLKERLADVDARIGRTALRQLAWIVAKAQEDLGEGALHDNWKWLWYYEVGYRKGFFDRAPSPKSIAQGAGEVREALGLVRNLICGLADGKVVRFVPEKSGDLALNIRRDTAGRLSREYRGPFSIRVFLRTLDLLEKEGPDRLRRCPYHPEKKPVCGRVFVKFKGQRFCSPDHARAAAYDAWMKRGMPRGGKRREARRVSLRQKRAKVAH